MEIVFKVDFTSVSFSLYLWSGRKNYGSNPHGRATKSFVKNTSIYFLLTFEASFLGNNLKLSRVSSRFIMHYYCENASPYHTEILQPSIEPPSSPSHIPRDTILPNKEVRFHRQGEEKNTSGFNPVKGNPISSVWHSPQNKELNSTLSE